MGDYDRLEVLERMGDETDTLRAQLAAKDAEIARLRALLFDAAVVLSEETEEQRKARIDTEQYHANDILGLG